MRIPKRIVSFLVIFLLLSHISFTGRAQTVPSANQNLPPDKKADNKQNDTIKPNISPKENLSDTPTAPPPDQSKPPELKAEATLPVPEASPLNCKISPDGSTATILFDKESVDAMRTLISQLEQNGTLGKVKGLIYSAAGITPILVLMGEKDELAQKLEILRQFLPDQSQAHMVVISASLRELQEADAYYVGLTLSPDIIGVQISGLTTGIFSTVPDTNRWDTALSASLPPSMPFSRLAQFQEAYNRGKVLVASEVYTRNGTKAVLTNVQSIPTFSVDSLKNVMTTYQNLETSVDVIPTTIEYNREKPEESQVRVDALVKISVITGTDTGPNGAQAPSYTTKTFATTRVLKANNERYVVGTFINDANYKAQDGVPFLSKIPILKYLFSQESNDSKRMIAILTLAVRLVPMKVKDLTIQVDKIDPLEELYKHKVKKPGDK
ncbi:MAG: type and secretion system protein [Deltaproteobacteria bacterium]|nr:type and secretion system protein [Deltaproteobacteria bacterium]